MKILKDGEAHESENIDLAMDHLVSSNTERLERLAQNIILIAGIFMINYPLETLLADYSEVYH